MHRFPPQAGLGSETARHAAEPPPCAPGDFRFGRFELQVGARRLLVDGRASPLKAKALDLLVALVHGAGRLMTRQQLMAQIWPGLAVEDGNLSVQINALRKVLGGDIITTVPGRGYQFTASIDAAGPPPPPAMAEPLRALAMLPAAPPSTHLPRVLPALIGRDADLAALAALVDAHALVTVTGAGGIGKTRLAQALLHARRAGYPHGVCFIELGAVTQPEAVPSVIAAALGLRLADDALPEALARALAPLTMLIALDNAEHLPAAVAAVAQALVSGAPRVRMLVTSQSRLRLAQESVYRLGALSVPRQGVDAAAAMGFGAVALFIARVQALDQRFVLDAGNVADVVSLCRRLDGSALAIELAAARLPLLGLPGLLASLAQRLSLLTQGHRGAPARQKNLRAALLWSHDLLEPAEQLVFRRLAVFVGSASLPMIQRVLADLPDATGRSPAAPPLDAWAVLDAVGGLVDKSMVSLVEAEHEAEPRYHLLGSPLALAVEQLQAEPDTPDLQRRHAQAVRALLEEAFGDLIDGRQGMDKVCGVLAADLDNADAALRWALVHDRMLALAIAPLLSLALGRNRHGERAALWRDAQPLLDAGPAVPPALLARARWQCAEHWATTRTQQALSQALQAHGLALAADDRRLACLAIGTIAPVAWRLGDLGALQRALQTVCDGAHTRCSPYVLASGATAKAWHCTLIGDQSGALHWFGEQARLFRAAGIDDALTVNNIAGLHLAAGNTGEAVAMSRALVTRFAGGRDQYRLAVSLSNLSAALLAEGQAAPAREVSVQFWPLAQQFEMHPQWADDAALMAALEGRGEAALRLAGFADQAFEALGQPREAVDQIRIDRAATLARQALAASHDGAACDRLRSEGTHLVLHDLPALAFGPEPA